MARQGWQKALENCSRVARSPSAAPISAAPSRAVSSRSRTVSLLLRRWCRLPETLAAASTPRHTMSPVIHECSVHGTTKIPGDASCPGRERYLLLRRTAG
ncbi:hypothetical protein Srufu_065890 [Streptomyces libani subsp. rufus]|nr:hypothetical protein Srufu_065890 [Streptomyces libani subsp. rufus]